MIEKLKKLKSKMERFDDEKLAEEKRENIEKLNEQLQKLESSEKLSMMIGNNGNNSNNEQINEIELDFLLDEIGKNKQLTEQLQTLTNELDGFIDIDLNEININNNNNETMWLDERIKYLERKFRSFLPETNNLIVESNNVFDTIC